MDISRQRGRRAHGRSGRLPVLAFAPPPQRIAAHDFDSHMRSCDRRSDRGPVTRTDNPAWEVPPRAPHAEVTAGLRWRICGCDLSGHRSRLWESNPRPTHYEFPAPPPRAFADHRLVLNDSHRGDRRRPAKPCGLQHNSNQPTASASRDNLSSRPHDHVRPLHFGRTDQLLGIVRACRVVGWCRGDGVVPVAVELVSL